MADQDNSRNAQQEPADLALARAVRDLEPDIQPARDLWPAIERSIVMHPQRDLWAWMHKWMPAGVAASLVIATAALVLGIVRTSETPPTTVTLRPAAMQATYPGVPNPMMAQFSRTNRNLDPVTLDDLYRNFEIMENARHEIERQLRAHPHDQQLMALLVRVREQEQALLKRNYTEPGHAM